MSAQARVAFLVAAIAVIVVAVLVIGRGDEESGTGTVKAVGATTTTAAQTPPATTPAKPVVVQPTLLKAGAERTLTYTKGEVVRFRVVHPTAEEVHVHGYDFMFDLQPGVKKTISFPARLEGQFEIELERSATPLAKLVVKPR